MARAAIVLCLWLGFGCSNNPYVIGRVIDAGSNDECKGAHARAIVCDGFETGALGSTPDQTVIENSGVIERSQLRAHDGHWSLHAASSAAESVGVAVKSFPAVRAGEFYLRSYLFVPAGLPTETMNFLFVGDDPNPDQNQEPFKGIDFNLENGAVQVFSPQSNPTRQTSTLIVPRARWFCFRVQISVAASGGRVRTYVDDQLALDAAGVSTLPDAGLHLLRAGVDWSSEQTAFFEIFIDDLVVDTKPVTCE